jgi:spoIIIJ-associated protein
MRTVEAEGSTIDEAIANALAVLRIDRSKAEIEILENATRGVLGLGGRPARVRATVRAPLGVEERNEAVSLETAEADGAVVVLRRILEAMGVEDDVTVEKAAEVTTLVVRGADTGVVIGRHGQTLDAIEYLLNRIAGRDGFSGPRVAVDVDGYRARRQESLEQSALRLAEKVKRSGRPESMAPMSARDRRIVHVALSEDGAVTTRSDGEGHQRRLTILPVRAPRRS